MYPCRVSECQLATEGEADGIGSDELEGWMSDTAHECSLTADGIIAPPLIVYAFVLSPCVVVVYVSLSISPYQFRLLGAFGPFPISARK